MFKHILITFISSGLIFIGLSQDGCEEIIVKGEVKDSLNPSIFVNTIVANITTNELYTLDRKGQFEIKGKVGDVIVFRANNYHKQSYEILDSYICKNEIIVYLSKEANVFPVIDIVPIKTVQEIKRSRRELAKNDPIELRGFQALNSPITALYERFSRIGRSKQRIAELEYQDEIERILKELFRVYISYDIIDLSEDEFFSFIDWLAISDQFLRESSDYDLVIYIKQRYKEYRMNNKD